MHVCETKSCATNNAMMLQGEEQRRPRRRRICRLDRVTSLLLYTAI